MTYSYNDTVSRALAHVHAMPYKTEEQRQARADYFMEELRKWRVYGTHWAKVQSRSAAYSTRSTSTRRRWL